MTSIPTKAEYEALMDALQNNTLTTDQRSRLWSMLAAQAGPKDHDVREPLREPFASLLKNADAAIEEKDGQIAQLTRTIRELRRKLSKSGGASAA